MIYKNNVYLKEMKQGYLKADFTWNLSVAIGLFMAFLTFGVYMILQTLTKSVLIDTIPYYMTKSYGSMLDLLIFISTLWSGLYFIIFYHYLTFAEVGQNRWYLLIQAGFSEKKIVFAKLYIRLMEGIAGFTTAFFAVLFFGFFLKLPVPASYFFSYYTAGLLNLLVVITVTMTLSLLVKEGRQTKYFIGVQLLVMWFLQHVTGYVNLIHSREKMKKISNLFILGSSFYVWLELFVIAACLILCYVSVKKMALYSNFELYMGDLDFPEDCHIVKKSGDGFTKPLEKKYTLKKKAEMTDRIVKGVMGLFVFLFLLINAVVIAVSITTIGKETDIFGYIPYVFQSDTMKPVIKYNDLALFTSKFKEEELKKGDIILYSYTGEPVVNEIQKREGTELTVDILNYPSNEKEGGNQKIISVSKVYGKYTGRSRWLGALIVFANTTMGRILLLFFPCIMLFYYQPIINYFRKKREQTYLQ